MQKRTWYTELSEKSSPFLVALAYIPWVVFLYLIVSNYAVNLKPNDQDIIQKFIEWFGTAYSLFLALVLGYVWAQFDNLDREFDREVDAVAALHQTAIYILTILETEEGETKKEKKEIIKDYINDIENNILSYVKHVISYFQVEYNDTMKRNQGEKILNSIGKKISLISYEGMIPETIISELFKNLGEAMDIRGDRISHSKQRMPSAVWLVGC